MKKNLKTEVVDPLPLHAGGRGRGEERGEAGWDGVKIGRRILRLVS